MNIRAFNGVKPRIGLNAYVDPAAVVIGDVELEDDASIWPAAVARGDVHRIRIGARTNIQDGAVLHVTHDSQFTLGGFPLLIGADVTVGHGAILHACTVQEACLIGMNATVLDGVLVKKNSMIGAGALVGPGKVVGERELWLGNPARLVRMLSDEEVQRLYYSAQHYIKLKNAYLAGGVG